LYKYPCKTNDYTDIYTLKVEMPGNIMHQCSRKSNTNFTLCI